MHIIDWLVDYNTIVVATIKYLQSYNWFLLVVHCVSTHVVIQQLTWWVQRKMKYHNRHLGKLSSSARPVKLLMWVFLEYRMSLKHIKRQTRTTNCALEDQEYSLQGKTELSSGKHNYYIHLLLLHSLMWQNQVTLCIRNLFKMFYNLQIFMLCHKYLYKLYIKLMEFWNIVIFRDESKFNIFGSYGKRFVWRKPNTELNAKKLEANCEAQKRQRYGVGLHGI